MHSLLRNKPYTRCTITPYTESTKRNPPTQTRQSTSPSQHTLLHRWTPNVLSCREGHRERDRQTDLFAVMEALEVVVPAGRALSWHGAVRHTIAEIHPHVVASSFLPRDPEPWRHRLQSIPHYYCPPHDSLSLALWIALRLDADQVIPPTRKQSLARSLGIAAELGFLIWWRGRRNPTIWLDEPQTCCWLGSIPLEQSSTAYISEYRPLLLVFFCVVTSETHFIALVNYWELTLWFDSVFKTFFLLGVNY